MWKKEKRYSAIVNLGLWLTLTTTPIVATLFVSSPILAKSAIKASSFQPPQTVANGTTVRIDGSQEFEAINDSLKQDFEKQFPNTQVEVSINGTDAALTALRAGKIDIAAIARQLTHKEKAQGLDQIGLYREKIAIIVRADNPFQGTLTTKEVVQIFRGKITNWSAIGGSTDQIRVIDYPISSDLRRAFFNYPALRRVNFAANTSTTEDSTAEIVKQLGKDGISYGIASEVSKIPEVRIVELSNPTSKGDSKYPFFQPLVYAYKKNPSINVVQFLGFALAPPGQKAIEIAKATTTAPTELQAVTTETVPPTPAPIPVASPIVSPPSTTTLSNEQPSLPPVVSGLQEAKNTPVCLLSPLFFIGTIGIFLVWWFRYREQPTEDEVDSDGEPNPSSPIIGINSIKDIPDVNGNSTNGFSHLKDSTLVGKISLDRSEVVKDIETTTSLSDLPGVLHVEPTTDEDTTHDVTTLLPDLPDPVYTELPFVALTTPELPDLPVVTSNNIELPDHELTNTLPELPETSSVGVEGNINLIPRTPKWAYVSWDVPESQKRALQQQGGSLLAVRLYDVTLNQSPQLAQQYECEEVANDRYIAIPKSNRDYMVEIGYVAKGNRWLRLARSAPIQVPGRPSANFWFIADSELVIHGATVPDANITIGGNSVKLKSDGTFHLRIPFSDGLIDYLITATAANGGETKTVHKKFSQETSES